MATNSIDIHPAALTEAKVAARWYLERSPAAASKFFMELESVIEKIMESPHRWPAGDGGTRKFVMQRFPFALIHREKGLFVQLLAIAHGHRRPGYWKSRL